MLRSYSTRIKNMREEIRQIERGSAEQVNRIKVRIARAEILVRALEAGELKP